MKELCSFGPWMKCNVNIALLCFKLLIMLEIILCCNRDIIPTWCVRKFIPRLTHFEKNYIFVCYGWYKFCMNWRVNRSICHQTPFVKTLKWNTDVHVRTCRYDVYEYTYVVFFLWGCYVVKLQDDKINESTSWVTCCSTLLYKLVMITRLERECEFMSMSMWCNVNLWVWKFNIIDMCIEYLFYKNVDLRYPTWIVPCYWMECNHKSAEWYD
jgi:hypothetical protein